MSRFTSDEDGGLRHSAFSTGSQDKTSLLVIFREDDAVLLGRKHFLFLANIKSLHCLHPVQQIGRLEPKRSQVGLTDVDQTSSLTHAPNDFLHFLIGAGFGYARHLVTGYHNPESPFGIGV